MNSIQGLNVKNRQYLLSRLQHYHRLKVLNYCVRDGNRCDHFDIVTGKILTDLFTQSGPSLNYGSLSKYTDILRVDNQATQSLVTT